jgi:hypothetical protein
MIVSVVGCGSSAQYWHKVPVDLSIAVNDAFKFGHQPDQLVVINFERKFTPQRLAIIKSTKPKRMFTHTSTWKKHFPNAEVIRLSPFNGFVRKGMIYKSKTSPIVAMSLAVNQGAKELILWGIDFETHKSYNKNNKQGQYEISVYLKFIEQLNKQGIKVWRGADGSAFDKQLPLRDHFGQPVDFTNEMKWE